MSSGQLSKSIHAQLEQNDVPEFANEPGPGHYWGPDSVGFTSFTKDPTLAKSISAPAPSFPKTGWPEWRRVHISKGHERSMGCLESPDAFYSVPEGLSKKAAPMSISTRPPLNAATCSPGPKYLLDHPSQAASMEQAWNRAVRCAKTKGIELAEHHPDGKFSKAERFPGGRQEGLEDKQMYIKTNEKSTLKGSGKSIGNGRAAWEKVLTPGYEAAFLGRTSPGVGPPLPVPGTKVGAKIGTAQRFPRSTYSTAGPGPAGYDVDHKGVAAKSHFVSDTKNPTAMSFGKVSKKPRFRVLAAVHGSPHGCWGYF